MIRSKHRIGARCYLPLTRPTDGTQQTASVHTWCALRRARLIRDAMRSPHTPWPMLPPDNRALFELQQRYPALSHDEREHDQTLFAHRRTYSFTKQHWRRFFLSARGPGPLVTPVPICNTIPSASPRRTCIRNQDAASSARGGCLPLISRALRRKEPGERKGNGMTPNKNPPSEGRPVSRFSRLPSFFGA
jgi:hypothetical protein